MPKLPRADALNATPERLRKAGNRYEDVIVEEDGRHFTRRRFMDGHILDWLLTHHDIDTNQAAAGDQFYGDWYASGLAVAGVVDPSREPVDGNPPRDFSDRVWAAKDRFTKAVKSIDWLHMHALNCVLIEEQSLESYGDDTQARWYSPGKNRTRAALNTFRNALDLLDAHYSGKRPQPRLRASAMADAKPAIRPDLQDA